MIPSLPRPTWLRPGTVVYALLFFTFLFLPLAGGGGVCIQ
jgi:spermidine/putrescine transport system permease protein